ncbi:MAG: AAA-like domain-containing protein [Cyanobacteria bacterium SBLK]|nr:AAA-like domain-containing protein [Cyanobacteria bacterium SBLK]
MERLDKLKQNEQEEFEVLANYIIMQNNDDWQVELSASKFAELLAQKKLTVALATAERRLNKFHDLGLIERVSQGNARNSVKTIILKDYVYQGSLLTGAIALDSPLYQEREADLTYKNVFRPDRGINESLPFIRIKGTKGMGKTSLLIRIRDFLENECNHIVAVVDLKSAAFDTEIRQDLEALFYQFTAAITQEFVKSSQNLNPPDLKMCWRKERSFGANCTNYLEEYVFKKIKHSKTLLIDGLDFIFGYEAVQTDFVNVLRTWNERKMKIVSKAPLVWPSIAIAYSTEPYPNRGDNVSPLYNIGILLELKEFTPQTILKLSKLYGLPWEMNEINALTNTIGGYPELVQQALYNISKNNLDLAELESKAIQVNGIFRYQLLYLEKLLDENEDIARGLKKILENKNISQSLAYRIQQMGLIRENDNGFRISCWLYEKFLRKKLLDNIGEKNNE